MSFSIETITEDYPEKELLNIWESSLSDLDSRRIRWSYVNNPEGKTVVLIARDDEKFIRFGVLAGFPRKLFFKGKLLSVAVTGDFAILPSFRSLLPALRLQKTMLLRNDFDLFVGFPNKQGYVVQKRVGFQDFAELTRFIKVLRSKDKLSKYLPDFICTLVAPIVDSFIKTYSKHWLVKLPKLVLKPSSNSFGDLDSIWEQAKNQFDFILNRSGRYLRWRFAEHPYKRYEILIFYNAPTHEPCAYVIYRLVNNVIEVEDFLWIGDEKVLMSVIVHFQKYCSKLEASVISFQCHEFPFIRNIFKSMGYIPRPGDKVVAYSSDKTFLNTAGVHRVFLTIGDNDI